MRDLDEDGLTICPQCGRHYAPDLPGPPSGQRRPMQEIYPDAKPYQREQLITGLCSDECWDAYLGSDGPWRGN